MIKLKDILLESIPSSYHEPTGEFYGENRYEKFGELSIGTDFYLRIPGDMFILTKINNKIAILLQDGYPTSIEKFKKFYTKLTFINNRKVIIPSDELVLVSRIGRDNSQSRIKLTETENDDDVLYVEYLREIPNETPFMLNGEKFQYVKAKYPSGKEDIGVYAFRGDLVYGYNAFRQRYNLK